MRRALDGSLLSSDGTWYENLDRKGRGGSATEKRCPPWPLGGPAGGAASIRGRVTSSAKARPNAQGVEQLPPPLPGEVVFEIGDRSERPRLARRGPRRATC